MTDRKRPPAEAAVEQFDNAYASTLNQLITDSTLVNENLSQLISQELAAVDSKLVIENAKLANLEQELHTIVSGVNDGLGGLLERVLYDISSLACLLQASAHICDVTTCFFSVDESVQNLLFTGNLDDSGDLNRKLSPYTFSALSLCTAWQNISELRRQPSLDLNVQHVDYSFAPLEDSVSISRLADVKHGGRAALQAVDLQHIHAISNCTRKLISRRFKKLLINIDSSESTSQRLARLSSVLEVLSRVLSPAELWKEFAKLRLRGLGIGPGNAFAVPRGSSGIPPKTLQGLSDRLSTALRQDLPILSRFFLGFSSDSEVSNEENFEDFKIKIQEIYVHPLQHAASNTLISNDLRLPETLQVLSYLQSFCQDIQNILLTTEQFPSSIFPLFSFSSTLSACLSPAQAHQQNTPSALPYLCNLATQQLTTHLSNSLSSISSPNQLWKSAPQNPKPPLGTHWADRTKPPVAAGPAVSGMAMLKAFTPLLRLKDCGDAPTQLWLRLLLILQKFVPQLIRSLYDSDPASLLPPSHDVRGLYVAISSVVYIKAHLIALHTSLTNDRLLHRITHSNSSSSQSQLSDPAPVALPTRVRSLLSRSKGARDTGDTGKHEDVRGDAGQGLQELCGLVTQLDQVMADLALRVLAVNVNSVRHSVLQSLNAFNWTKKRDVPRDLWPSLNTALPCVYGLSLFLQGAFSDLTHYCPVHVAQTLFVQLLKDCSVSLYTRLSQIQPSRYFHRTGGMGGLSLRSDDHHREIQQHLREIVTAYLRNKQSELKQASTESSEQTYSTLSRYCLSLWAPGQFRPSARVEPLNSLGVIGNGLFLPKHGEKIKKTKQSAPSVSLLSEIGENGGEKKIFQLDDGPIRVDVDELVEAKVPWGKLLPLISTPSAWDTNEDHGLCDKKCKTRAAPSASQRSSRRIDDSTPLLLSKTELLAMFQARPDQTTEEDWPELEPQEAVDAELLKAQLATWRQ